MAIYIPKLISHTVSGEKSSERLYPPCSGLQIWYLVHCNICGGSAMDHTDEYVASQGHEYKPVGCGRQIDLIYENGAEVKRINLPQDGQVLYIMNEHGRTVQTYRWPDPFLAPVEALEQKPVMRTGVTSSASPTEVTR